MVSYAFIGGFHIYDGVRGIHECKRSTNAVFTRSPKGKNVINEAKPKRGFLFYSATCRICRSKIHEDVNIVRGKMEIPYQHRLSRGSKKSEIQAILSCVSVVWERFFKTLENQWSNSKFLNPATCLCRSAKPRNVSRTCVAS